MDNKLEKVFIVSYIPFNDLTTFANRDASIDEITAIIDQHSTEGWAKACLWVMDKDDNPQPILLFERAKELADHLIAWSEGKPAERFTVHFYDFGEKGEPGTYCVMLIPRQDKSIERWKMRHLHFYGEFPPSDITVEMAFLPIRFGTKGSTTYQYVKDKLPKPGGTILISFLDLTNFDRGQQSFDDKEIIEVGEFEVGCNDALIPWFENFLTNLEYPAEGLR